MKISHSPSQYCDVSSKMSERRALWQLKKVLDFFTLSFYPTEKQTKTFIVIGPLHSI